MFTETLLEVYQSFGKQINPLSFMQTGVEVLFLFIYYLKNGDENLYKELLNVEEYKEDFEEVINDINMLQK